MSAESKSYSGDQIKGLFSRPSSVDIVVKNKKYGEIKFIVRPMNNDIYAKMGSVMKSNGIDLEKASSLDGLKVFSDMYYPAMKVVFPYCAIDPKIVDGESKGIEGLNIADIPMDVCLDLFNQIMEVSGLSEKAEEDRKN